MRIDMSGVLKNPAWISFTWFGMTAGVSLLATPVRFSVVSLSRPLALDVSRTVFAALNKAEFVALIILLVITRVSGQARETWAVVATLALILMAQSAWLLPELSARTDLILAGIEPQSSIAHGAYSILEIAKLLLLLFIGVRSLQTLALGKSPYSKS